MPSRSKSSSIVAPQGSILLLEEYDALAAAIGSALEKFAPKHRSEVARSLAEAEKLTAQLKPELFVLDVDPPWAGLTNFLDKISAMLPNARVLVIGATIPTEITAERGPAGARCSSSKSRLSSRHSVPPCRRSSGRGMKRKGAARSVI